MPCIPRAIDNLLAAKAASSLRPSLALSRHRMLSTHPKLSEPRRASIFRHNSASLGKYLTLAMRILPHGAGPFLEFKAMRYGDGQFYGCSTVTPIRFYYGAVGGTPFSMRV